MAPEGGFWMSATIAGRFTINSSAIGLAEKRFKLWKYWLKFPKNKILKKIEVVYIDIFPPKIAFWSFRPKDLIYQY